MPGKFFPPQRVSYPHMHHGTCVTHVPWCMSGSLINGFNRSRWREKRSRTSNGSWCMGIKGEMSGTVCVTFTWYMYIYIWVVYSFCLFCCLFIIVTTQFVALYKPCKPKPKPSTYDTPPPPPRDNHPLAEIHRPILRPEPKQQICHQHANTDHFGK